MKVTSNRAGDLGVHFPSFRHALEAIWGSFSANFATKRGFQKPFSLYLLLLQIVKTPSRCKWVANATGRGFDNLCLNSKCNGKGFSKKFLLEIFEILYHVSKSLWFFLKFCALFWKFMKFLKFYTLFWNFVKLLYHVLKFCEIFVILYPVFKFCKIFEILYHVLKSL